jgi:hypothetical protein
VPKGRSAVAVAQVVRDRFFSGYREAEFLVVCDVKKESSQVIQELNDAQVIKSQYMTFWELNKIFRRPVGQGHTVTGIWRKLQCVWLYSFFYYLLLKSYCTIPCSYFLVIEAHFCARNHLTCNY